MRYVIGVLVSVLVFHLVAPHWVEAQEVVYQNPDVPLEARVDDLLSRMTLEEKVSQMLNDAPAIERLGIPKYDWWNECLHGVARAGIATVFPQAIGLGATWNPDLIHQMAVVISDEARAKYHEAIRGGIRERYRGLTMWSPNINIFRDPRWGRGQETYGEDPYLTSRIGVAFVTGLQGDHHKYLKVVSTPKHYAIHSGPEADRHHFDATPPLRDLYDTYLPAFESTVRDGGARSVMCAYNRAYGEACCASTLLMVDILRDRWGFDGYVVSDCGAINDIYEHHGIAASREEAASVAVKAGCDLNCGGTYHHLVQAVEQGLITEAELDRSLKRLFMARFRLGQFDPPEQVPYAQIPFSRNDCQSHRDLALEVARESIVLLNNENDILPLDPELESIAVIGPNADSQPALLGNYHGMPSHYVTVLQGIRNRVSEQTTVTYVKGCNLVVEAPVTEVVPATVFTSGESSGLTARYFDNPDFAGEPLVTRIDQTINSNWNRHPVEGLELFDFSVRWTGTLRVEETGDYIFSLDADDGGRLFIDDSLLIDQMTQRSRGPTSRSISLQKGQNPSIRVDYVQGKRIADICLSWSPPGQSSVQQAVAAARGSDVVVFVGGIDANLEREARDMALEGFEGGDRTRITLPRTQRELLKALEATGTPVVLVCMSGSAMGLVWEDEHLPAILQAWYPGQEGGNAVADVIFGTTNPSGKLPVTFYRSVDQLPPFDDYSMVNRTYRYFEGEPLYPFGYGLSYTDFNISDLTLDKTTITPQETVRVSVTVTNTGDVAGHQVVQLYIGDRASTVRRPIRALAAFQKVHLQPGESRPMHFDIPPEKLSFYDIGRKTEIVEPGVFDIGVGFSSAELERVRLSVESDQD